MPRQRHTFTDDFKRQMVQLFENRKSRAAIAEEYELSPSALDRWIKQAQTTGSFSEKDNRSPEENELIALRKEIQRLKMENDILKQTAKDRGRCYSPLPPYKGISEKSSCFIPTVAVSSKTN